METATTLSKDIQTAGDTAQYDASAKRLLAEKIILAWILKSCVEEFQNIDIKDITEKYIEGEPQISKIPVMPDETNRTSKIKGMGVEDTTMTEGTITFDILFEAIIPASEDRVSLIINVENQNDFYPGYPLIKRSIYYCSRMLSSQYGTVFTKSHYERLKKVYSIWICTNPPQERQNSITGYSIAEKNYIGNVKEQLNHYDLFSAIMICLGKPESENYAGILKLLGVLLASDIEPEDKKELLEHDFDIPMTEKLERRVKEMSTLGQSVLEKGMEKGIEKGAEAAELSAISNLMKKLKMTAEQAMDTLDISMEKRGKYRSMLGR